MTSSSESIFTVPHTLSQNRAAQVMKNYRYIAPETVTGAVVVRFLEPDLSGIALAESLQVELFDVISEFSPARLVVDFEGVKMIASSVIGALLTVRKRQNERGGMLLLCRVPVPIREVYRTLNLEGRMLRVFPSVEAAIQAPLTIPAPFEQYED